MGNGILKGGSGCHFLKRCSPRPLARLSSRCHSACRHRTHLPSRQTVAIVLKYISCQCFHGSLLDSGLSCTTRSVSQTSVLSAVISSSSALASFRSGVSKPSVNQL